MKAQVYREMSTDELEGKVQELQRHVFDLHSHGD
jgi:ribosomal protein L29